MHSEMEQYFSDFSTRVNCGAFSDPDPDVCECRGSGWFLSSVDTWHECPAHRGQPHPEDYDHDDTAQHDAHVWTFFCHNNQPTIDSLEDDIPF